jgi:hypothetical protein
MREEVMDSSKGPEPDKTSSASHVNEGVPAVPVVTPVSAGLIASVSYSARPNEYLYIGDDWPSVLLDSIESGSGRVVATFTVHNIFHDEVSVSLDSPETSTYLLDSAGYAYNFEEMIGGGGNSLSLRPGERANFSIAFKGPEVHALRTLSLGIKLRASGVSAHGSRSFGVSRIRLERMAVP